MYKNYVARPWVKAVSAIVVYVLFLYLILSVNTPIWKVSLCFTLILIAGWLILGTFRFKKVESIKEQKEA